MSLLALVVGVKGTAGWKGYPFRSVQKCPPMSGVPKKGEEYTPHEFLKYGEVVPKALCTGCFHVHPAVSQIVTDRMFALLVPASANKLSRCSSVFLV